MSPIAKAVTLSLLLAAPVAAHNGVKDPQVMARMKVMGQVGDATKVLGNMARGKIAFDASEAAKAAAMLKTASEQVVPTFTLQASDPKSEAKPEIWSRFDAFSKDADALTAAAEAVDTSSLPALQQGLRAVGQTCKSCHSEFRINSD